MARPKHTYSVEVEWSGRWRPIISPETRDYCLGYLAAHRQHPGPRLAVRVTRSDGKVMDSSSAEDRASLGMVAGFPTAEQYERAAERALESAREIRARTERREASRAERAKLAPKT